MTEIFPMGQKFSEKIKQQQQQQQQLQQQQQQQQKRVKQKNLRLPKFLKCEPFNEKFL